MSQFEAGTMLAIKDFISAYKCDLNRQLALATQLEGLLAAVGHATPQTALQDHQAARRRPTSKPAPAQQPQAIWSQWPTGAEARQQRQPPQASPN
jgi:hypothetical protein